MGEWLKDRPLAQMLLNTTLSLLVLLVMFWISGFASDNDETNKAIQNLQLEKAGRVEVEAKIKSVEEGQFKKDKEQDEKIETIRTENRADHLMMIEKLDKLIELQLKNK